MRSLLLHFHSSGPSLRGWKYMSVFLLLGLLSLGSCKEKRSSEELEREQQRADSLMKAAAEAQKRLETEEELAERIRLLKNKTLIGNDSVYYAAQVTARPDSLLSVVTLKGKANRSGNISTFNHTAIALEAQVARGTMEGNYFRRDLLGNNRYRLYSFDEDSGKVYAYLLEPSGNALQLTPDRPVGNYRFDLLKQRSFRHTLDNEARFFRTIKSSQITDNPEWDSLYNQARIYRDREGLLPGSVSAPFTRLWLYGEHGSSNVLLTHPTDSTLQTVTLSGRYVNPRTEVNISSVFQNDSTWLQTTVSESLVYDHPHLVVYQRDSVNRSYRYDADFHFQLLATDTITTKLNYPQYYPELKDSVFEVRTDVFNMNNKKAYWRYSVNYAGTSKTPGIRVKSRDLVDAKNDRLIFRLPAAGTPRVSTLAELLTPRELFKGKDLNFDGAADLSFRKGTDVNNNPIYIVYLYEPGTGRFRRTPELDGRSVFQGIIRDTIHKRLLYAGYIDGGHMSASLTNPTPGNEKTKEIYWTTGDPKAPQVHYQKMVNNSITDKRSPALEQLPLKGRDLPEALINWILSSQIAP